MSEIRIHQDSDLGPREVFGTLDANLKTIEKDCGVEVAVRGDEIIINGAEPERAASVIGELFTVAGAGQQLDEQKVNYILELSREGISYAQSTLAKDVVCFTHKGKPLKAKTLGQKQYVDAVRKNDIVFGIGPAGTGKSYLAVAMAINALKNK